MFGVFREHFARAVKSGNRLRHLRADVRKLEYRGGKKAHVHGVLEETAGSHLAADHFARAQVHDGCSHDAHHERRTKAHGGHGIQRAHYIVENSLHARAEDALLAFFCVIALHHANAAERFRKPAADFGVDLAALAEDRADFLERFIQDQREDHQRADRDSGHDVRNPDHEHQDDGGREHSSGKFHQAGADKIAHTFHVTHDA